MENDNEEVFVEEETTEEVEEVDEETIEEVDEEEGSEADAEDVDGLKKKLATAEAQKKHWREKAEAKEPAENTSLSSGDLLAIMKAEVHEDDIERVEQFAKMEGQSVREVLKNPEMKAILDLRNEQRTTASAANITNARRGNSKVTDESLLQAADKGVLPEDDSAISQLIAAKRKNND